MKKKLLFFAAILIFIVSVTCLSVSAQTYSGTCGAEGDNLTWVLDEDGTLTISGEGEMEAWKSSNDVPWNNYKKNIKEVHIEAGVTSVGFAAFANCDALTNVTIPSSVTSMGTFSLASCTSLNTITYGGNELLWNLMYWDKNSGNYKMIYLNEYTVIHGDSSTWKIDSEGVLTIYGTMQLGDWNYIPWLRVREDIKTLIIEDAVSTKIGKDAFALCDALTNVVIGDGVTSIEEMAFFACSSLKNLTIGDSVISVDDSAFHGCNSLENITIGKNLATNLGFAPSLKNIDVDISNPNFASVDGVLFNKDKTTLISYPSGKTEKSYIVPDSVISIDEGAFAQSGSLEHISISDSVTSIGDVSLAYCPSLETIYFYGTEDEWNQISKGEYWDIDAGSSTESGTYKLVFMDPSEYTTDTPETTTSTPSENGCGSFIGGGLVVVTAIFGSAWISKKR